MKNIIKYMFVIANIAILILLFCSSGMMVPALMSLGVMIAGFLTVCFIIVYVYSFFKIFADMMGFNYNIDGDSGDPSYDLFFCKTPQQHFTRSLIFVSLTNLIILWIFLTN